MKLYQTETHCHTKEVSACSRIPAEYLIARYADLGYKYVFITDHYNDAAFRNYDLNKNIKAAIDHYETGFKTAEKYARDNNLDLKVLQGMEVTLNPNDELDIGNDFLVYGFDEEFLLDNTNLHKMNYKDFYNLMNKEGFLVFQAHPYRYGNVPVEPICYDGVEIVNTHPGHMSHNLSAVKFAEDKDLYKIGGSDAHCEEDAGRGGIMLPSGIESARDLVSFYKENGSPELIVTYGA